jgi:hypothetical protein
MKKQYLLFMAIMNFMVCPLEEGIRSFNHGLLISSILKPDGGLDTALFTPIPPNRNPLKIGPAGVVIRIPPTPYNLGNDPVIYNPNVLVSCLGSGAIFTKEWHDITLDAFSHYFMGDPEKESAYTRVQNTTIERLVHLLKQSPYTEIEPWGLVIKVEENGSVTIYQKSEREQIIRNGVIESYPAIINALCMSMLTGKESGLIVLDGTLEEEQQIPNMIPRSFQKPYRHPTNRLEDIETYFTTSDAIIAYMEMENPFIQFVQQYINYGNYTLYYRQYTVSFINHDASLLCASKEFAGMMLDLNNPHLVCHKLPQPIWITIIDYLGPVKHEISNPQFAEMCPDAQRYKADLWAIPSLPRPQSYSEAALRLNPLYPLLSQQNLENIIPRTMALLKECYSLSQSNMHYRGFPVFPLMPIIKPNERNWRDFLKQFEKITYLKVLCRYFGMEYSENVTVLFNDEGFDKLSPNFSNIKTFYPIDRKQIPPKFDTIIGLQKNGTIQFMVKFEPGSFTKSKKQTWKQALGTLSPDLKQRLAITGEVLVLSGGSRAEWTKTWDEGFGVQYTLETLPDKFAKAIVRVNPNGELEIRADVPQAAEEPVVAPAPVV